MKITNAAIFVSMLALATSSFSAEILTLKSGKKIQILDNHSWVEIDSIKGDKPSTHQYDTAAFAKLIETKVDRFDNSETYKTKDQFVTGDGIKVTPVVICSKGECMISLKLVSSSESWRFLKYRKFAVICDGENIDIEEPTHDGSVGSGYVLEQMWADIAPATFMKISSCQVLDAKLGIYEFSIPKANRKSWQVLAERFN